MTSFTLLLNVLKVNKYVQVKIIHSKMTYSESESDLSFAINSVPDFDSASESNSESDSKSESRFQFSVYESIHLYFSLFYICIRLNNPADGFFIHSHNRINSYASNASIMHISFWYIIIQKVCFYYTIKFSYFSF